MPEILSDNGHSWLPLLDSLNVLSLPAFRAFGHHKLHRLPFLQTAEAASLNCGEMYEDILPILTGQVNIPAQSPWGTVRKRFAGEWQCFPRTIPTTYERSP